MKDKRGNEVEPIRPMTRARVDEMWQQLEADGYGPSADRIPPEDVRDLIVALRRERETSEGLCDVVLFLANRRGREELTPKAEKLLRLLEALPKL